MTLHNGFHSPHRDPLDGDFEHRARITVKDGETITDVMEITAPYLAVTGFIAEHLAGVMRKTDHSITVEITPSR